MLPSTTPTYRCFYSGLQLIRLHSPTVQGDCPKAVRYSQEHLLPKTLMRKRKVEATRNTVPASTLINSLVGAAPLRVKFALKEHFRDVDVMGLDGIQLRQKVEQTVKNFLDRYKVHELYPWEWSGGKQKAHTKTQRKEIYHAMLALLTPEEKEFRLYKKM